ncbi:MAG: hypothetical protein HY762_04630 [Planctomycetes bacterium]|nr:hypothetical protein [Planctomycetota bacterium]
MISEENVLSALLIYLPAVNEFPLANARKWAEGVYKQACHTSGRRRQAIHTLKDYRQKLAQPALEHGLKAIPDGFISKSGLSAETIRRLMRARMLSAQAGHKYMDKLDKAFRVKDGISAKKLKDGLPFGAADYAVKMTFGNWRFIGPAGTGEQSPLFIAVNWLNGNQKTVNYLRAKDKLVKGGPLIIAEPDKTGRFKMQLRAQLMRSANIISACNYAADIISDQNDRLNQLVNRFARPDLAPFVSGGASHLDFVIIPASIEPDDSPKIRDILYRIYAHFLGQATADGLKARWTVTRQTDQQTVRPYQKAHFDMHLDIRVMTRIE